MRLLLDTHIAVWATLTPERLSVGEQRVLSEAEAPLFVSAVTVWELGLKWQSFHVSGTRKGPVAPDTLIGFAASMGWVLLPLTPQHAAGVLRPGLDHRDPFDAMLLIQAQAEGLRLLTRDSKLLLHPVAVGGSLPGDVLSR